jgi:nucleoside-diphosphate-sugar epimerase
MNASEASSKRTAVVVGATGIMGRAITEALAKESQWNVIALSRSGESVPGADQAIAVDLLDPENARRQLLPVAGTTHLFFAAYQPQPTLAEEVAPNRALLVNAIEGLEAAGSPLEHVILVTGAKYYGVHLGPTPSPAREEQSRHLGPNFQYAQEDYLRSRTDAMWRWTHLISTHLTGFATGNPMNLALAIGVYASIIRELGLCLYFPGSRAAFDAMTQIVDADQVGQAVVCSATSEAASNEVFNIANGDPIRWSQLWPEIAAYFGVQTGGPRPLPLASTMPEHSDLWRRLAQKHGLKYPDLARLVNWKFLEFVVSIEYDIVLALGKIRRAGFTQHPDTMSGFRNRFDEYITQGVLPKVPLR